MARKTARYTAPTDSGRDAGKIYVLTEWPARVGHAWATRALFAMANAGVEVPDNLAGAGFAAVAAMGIKALGKIPAAVGQPLLEELLTCVQVQPGTNPDVVRGLVDDDIEEVLTIFKLQKEVLALHVDFSTLVPPLTLESSGTPGA